MKELEQKVRESGKNAPAFAEAASEASDDEE